MSASPRERVTGANAAAPDWRAVAWHLHVSRALDTLEEKTLVPERKIFYQFSARGHDLAQILLGLQLTHKDDAICGYYRSRPILLTLGVPVADTLGSCMARAGGYSDGRDIGAVFNFPNPNGPSALPMCGGVGAQFTPTAGWAQALRYRQDVLGEKECEGAIAVVLGGDASVATNGFWSALTIATTLKLPMLFYIDDNGLGISVKSELQTPGANIAKNLASFTNLFVRDGDGCNPGEAAALLAECVDHVRRGEGPALVRLTVPRLSSHSGPDNQKGYRTEEEIAADNARDPLPRLRQYLVPAFMSEDDWAELEARVTRDVQAAADAARARPAPEPADIKRFIYAETPRETDPVAQGGLSAEEREALGGTDTPE